MNIRTGNKRRLRIARRLYHKRIDKAFAGISVRLIEAGPPQVQQILSSKHML